MRVAWMVMLALGWACAAQSQDLRMTPEAKAACGQEDTSFHVTLGAPTLLAADPGKAVVYVVEETNHVDPLFGTRGALSRIGMDGKWIGATHGNSFLAMQVSPGVHHLCAGWQSHAAVLSHLVALNVVEAEAGKAYYFLLVPLVGGPNSEVLQFSLDLVNEDEGRMLTAAYPQSYATSP